MFHEIEDITWKKQNQLITSIGNSILLKTGDFQLNVDICSSIMTQIYLV